MAGNHGTRRTPVLPRIWRNSAVRYLVVGGLCFAIDVALLWFAHEVLGIPLAVATPIAFLSSFLITYTLQRLITFTSQARVTPSVARYTALVAVNTVAVTAIVWLFDMTPAGWLVGKTVSVAATTVWNYYAYRYWVFASPKSHPVSDV